ncbi:hypothetical protein J437_LFUL000838 [Ladona fulva]|uniref:Transglutaminase-like domain-containing protein n=1 Tax=Ladona fulva TaxID=123851 RepID=A0A8K0JU60_LADFU|nr:hypothetical protein J437_LFUL000838 [Ladona fulva]
MSQPEVVESVDFLFDKNAAKHRTNKFEQPKEGNMKVVLRRGQPFTVKINMRGTTIMKSNIWVVFTLGSSPNTDVGTKGMAKINFKKQATEDKPTGWDAFIKKTEGNSHFVQVNSPSNTPVSLWNFHIEIETEKGNKALFSAPNSIWILFNPWMEADLVHMSETELLNEYVLSDVGKVWRGSKVHDAKGYPWVYGQFDEYVLPVCMTILKQVPESERGDPIKVVRTISKMVRTSPFAWTGSIAILEEYYRTNTGVKWGQCWVFATLVTTICRALGIPCRNVTNFESAHDTNGSCTIEYYLDKNNKPINPTKRNESIWNFHVWNDVWMARPDLPKGYGGWQAIDATPQEKSDGYYQCGPASVEAIRNGSINLKYDVPFIVAEVNADILYLKEDPNSETGYRKVDQYQRNVGQGLFTKKPGKYDPNGESDREDVMNQYKHPEGIFDKG